MKCWRRNQQRSSNANPVRIAFDVARYGMTSQTMSY